MTRFRRLAKEGSWIVVGQIATVAGSLAMVGLLTAYLDPAQYGLLALGLTVASFINQVVMGGISNGIGRFYVIAAEKHDLNSYLNATRLLLVYATGFIVLISLVLIVTLLWMGHYQWAGLAAASLLLALLNGYNGALSSIQNAARQRAVVAFHGGLDAWLRILLALALVQLMGATSTAVTLGYAFSSLLIMSSQMILLRHAIPPQLTHRPADQHWLPQIWAYSLPFCLWGPFTWLQLASDRWALQTFSSTSEVGQYSVLFQLGYTPIALLTGMTANFLGPILYQRSGDASNKSRNANVDLLSRRMTYLVLLFTLVGAAIAAAGHELLFSLLVAKEYRGTSHLLPWVVLAGGVFASGQMLALKLMTEMKSKRMTTAKIFTAVVGMIFNVMGAAFAGVQGVVGSLVAFSLMYLFWMAFLVRNTSTEVEPN